jgi:hypothetical protein
LPPATQRLGGDVRPAGAVREARPVGSSCEKRQYRHCQLDHVTPSIADMSRETVHARLRERRGPGDLVPDSKTFAAEVAVVGGGEQVTAWSEV